MNQPRGRKDAKLRIPPGSPRERVVPLINHAGRTLAWFIEDVGSLRR